MPTPTFSFNSISVGHDENGAFGVVTLTGTLADVRAVAPLLLRVVSLADVGIDVTDPAQVPPESESPAQTIARLTRERDAWKARAAKHGCNVDEGDPDCG